MSDDTLQIRINFAKSWNAMQMEVHQLAIDKGWWQQKRSALELLTLVASECCGEGVEGVRKPGPSTKIPAFLQIEEELADTLIRIGDMCGRFGIMLGEHIAATGSWGIGEFANFAEHYAQFVDTIPLEKHIYLAEFDDMDATANLNDVELLGTIIIRLATCLMQIGPDGKKPARFFPELTAAVVLRIMAIGQRRGWRIGEALVAKHEYNKTRPERHGGKLY